MFWVTAALSVAFVVWGAVFTSSFAAVATSAFGFAVSNLGWFYMVVTTLFVGFVIVLAFSRYGKVKLGKEGEEPEFGWFSWVGGHALSGGDGARRRLLGRLRTRHALRRPAPRRGAGEHDGGRPDGRAVLTGAAQTAVQYSFFHWGLHAWAVFAVTGLAVAYFNFRKDTRGLISAVFYPILGERVNGPIGKAIDILAIFVTLVGVAVSLGQGGLQIGAGLDQVFGFSNVLSLQLVIILVTAVAYMLSAATPINKGVKWLSNMSMIVGAFLALYFLIVGPTVLQLNAFIQGIGDYLNDIVSTSLRVNSFDEDTDFLGKFTLFFWGWWVTWAAYVGVFAARISRGRSIREFALGILIVPSLICIAWFAIVGASAIELDQTLGGTLRATAQSDPAIGFFAFLQYYPLPILLSVVSLFLLWIFFVAGADAGTIVLGEISVGGITDPNRFIRLAWGAVISAFAAVLLLAGGLEALQQAAILAGLPFAIVMIFMCYTLYKSLREDFREGSRQDESQEEMAAEEPAAQPAANPSE